MSGAMMGGDPGLRNFGLRRWSESIARSGLASRLATGTVWSLIGGVTSQFLAFLASVWIARQLGGGQFGEYAMIRSTAMTFAILAAFGIGLTATKHIAESCGIAPRRTGGIVVFSISFAVVSGGLMAAVLFVAASPLATHALHASHLAGLLRVGSLLLFFTTVGFAQTGVLAGFEAFREITRIGVVGGSLTFVALVAATSLAGLPGATWGAVIGLGAHCLLNHRAILRAAVSRGIPLRARPSLREWRILGIFTLPVALSNVVTASAMWVCHLVLAGQSGGYVQLGIFNIANQWRTMILFIPERICQITLPVLSSLLGEGRLAGFRRTLVACVGVTAGVSLMSALLVGLMSPWIVRAYGSDFISGSSALSLLAVSAVFASISLIIDRALVSLGRVWLRFAAHILWAVVLLGCGYVFLSRGGGARGLALAVLIACGINMIFLLGSLLWSARGSAGGRVRDAA